MSSVNKRAGGQGFFKFLALSGMVLTVVGCSDDGGGAAGSGAAHNGGSAGATSAGKAGSGTTGGKSGRGGSSAGSGHSGGANSAGGTTSEGGSETNAGSDSSGGVSGNGVSGSAGSTSGGATQSGGSSATGGSSNPSGGGAGESGAAGEPGAGQGGEVGVGGSGVSSGGIGGVGGSVTSGGSAGTESQACQDGETRPCCHEGHQTCSGGAWGACTGALISAESCNGVDDDCNGQVDELGTTTCGVGACATTVSLCGASGVNTCTPGTPAVGPDGCDGVDNDCDGAVDEDCAACIHVAPNGDDAAALANENMTPFLTIQAAIDFAAARPDIATRVCVAAGASCGLTATFLGPSNADLTMRDGVDVFGGYESTTFTRCTSSTTHLAPQTGKGVLFQPSLTAKTTLDGFTIDRYTSGTSATGVTIDGAKHAMLSNLDLPRPGTPVAFDYGVTLANGADVLIFKSSIQGGSGSTESAALSSVGAKVAVEDSTLSFDDSGQSFFQPLERVIVLEDSPGSRLERSTVSGVLTYSNPNQRQDAIEIHGDATGSLLRQNTISTTLRGNGNNMAAIAATDCGGASLWIGDNVITPTSAGFPNSMEAVYAAGACHPIIDSNASIVVTVGTTPTNVIHCSRLSGVSSDCVISRNHDIGANVSFSGSVSLNTVTGVLCDGASCSRIDENVITAVKQSTFSMSSGHPVVGQGLLLGSSSALVDRNSITGLGAGVAACNLDGYGVSGGSTASRIQNNRIYGAKAPTSNPLGCAVSSSVYGIQSALGQVYSNHIAAWPNGECLPAINGDPKFYGVVTSAGGDYHNNAIEGCAAVKEANASADPLFFENNALLGGYLDEGGDFPKALQPDTRINVAQVNALTDMTSSSNIDGPCYAAGSDKLDAGSACIDAGTPSGAPTFDYDGERRGAAPDIGSDEYVH